MAPSYSALPRREAERSRGRATFLIETQNLELGPFTIALAARADLVSIRCFISAVS